MEYTKKFNDIQAHWSKESVERIGAKHILDEMSPRDFRPDQKITRAEFAAILAKSLYKGKEKDFHHSFKDVGVNQWYTKYLNIATELGFIQGTGNSYFEPEGELTREALVVMLMRAYRYTNGEKVDSNEEMLKKFQDVDKMSIWAKQEIAYAYEKGLVYGVSDNEFAPQQLATRAQAVTMLDRLLNNLYK